MYRFQTYYLLFLLFAFTLSNVSAQEGYKIDVEVKNFPEKEAYLAYYYGDKPYIKDTVVVDPNGRFTFQGEESLDGGIYLIVLPPDNQFVQIFISEGEQRFSVKADNVDLNGSIEVEGSPDNKLFYDYMAFLSGKIKEKERLMGEKEKADEAGKKAVDEKLEQMDVAVKAYHNNIITKHPKTLTAAFVSNRVDPELPEFEGTDEEIQIARWHYVKDHYFDNFDMTDERLVHAPFFFQRVNQYIEKLTVQHPDSLTKGIDTILKQVQPAEETFKFYLVHFLNKYAKSKIVGMDAVYVHLVENYYEKGLAPWTEKEQLDKIIKNGKTLKPILIGKTAPNISVQKEDKTPISLHDVKSDFTVMIFWAPDCGHCKKSMPKLIEFYDKFKDRSVEIFAVCSKVTDKVPECWKFIDEREDMKQWINVVDPYLKSRYKQIYDVRTTPQIFVLDENKKILSKRIGVEQLEDVLEKMIELKAKEKS
ncbi:MAG: redoxin family protein [Saprospiraceae bacterium]